MTELLTLLGGGIIAGLFLYVLMKRSSSVEKVTESVPAANSTATSEVTQASTEPESPAKEDKPAEPVDEEALKAAKAQAMAALAGEVDGFSKSDVTPEEEAPAPESTPAPNAANDEALREAKLRVMDELEKEVDRDSSAS